MEMGFDLKIWPIFSGSSSASEVNHKKETDQSWFFLREIA